MTGSEYPVGLRIERVEERQIEHAERLSRVEAEVASLKGDGRRFQSTAEKQNEDDGRRSAWQMFLALITGGGLVALLDKLFGGQG